MTSDFACSLNRSVKKRLHEMCFAEMGFAIHKMLLFSEELSAINKAEFEKTFFSGDGDTVLQDAK